MAEAGPVIEIEVNVKEDTAVAERPKVLNVSGKNRRGSSDARGETPRSQGLSQVLKELLTNSRPRMFSHSSPSNSAEYISSPHTAEATTDYPEREDVKVLKIGPLHKTSQSRRPNAEPGPTRQRRFRLTPESLEYFQHFSHVKIRRNYPLTSLEELDYPADGDKQELRLYFASYVMTLRSDSESDAEEWADMIRNAWKEWQLPTPEAEPVGVVLPVAPLPTLDPIAEVDETQPASGHPSQVPQSPPRDHHPSPPPPASPPSGHTSTSNTLPHDRQQPYDRPRSHSAGFLRRESSEPEFPTYDKRRKQRKIRGLIKNIGRSAPQLQKQQPHTATSLSSKLHEEHAMIKYPRSRWSIPAEKVVNLDKDNLVVIWKHHERDFFKRKSVSTRHKLKSYLGLNKVLEVRKGQLTEKFDQFPYEEVEDQSFSLIFEQVTKRYVRLTSLDLICDSREKCEDWIHGLRETTNHLSCSIFPSEHYETTDPTIVWLKQLWAASQCDHELSQSAATEILTMFQPGTIPAKCRQILSDSHHYQFRHTYLRGNALRWDGFVLMLNLLLGNTGRLGALFKKYAVKYPKLGMTEDELRSFLRKECQWPESHCSSPDLQALIAHHDYHHRAYKKFVAQGIPLDYQIGSSLLSYAGFLSFLRSKDNSPIVLEHTTCFMDMTQPLSHYFINSSHNTYLEADQLYGKSSTDAYVRALLQGCRCIEIDCWDDTFSVTGVGEPLIYHGYTLTTKLPFREVIQTIREYAFTASLYPLIISIENHCSSAQQAKMAKIFQSVMGDVLPKENLCEKENRDRLPSPEELQGKIILKGSFKLQRAGGATPARRPPRQDTQQQSLSFLPPDESLAVSPTSKEPPPVLEPTAVALLQSKQQLPSRRSLHRSRSSTYRNSRQRMKESVHDLEESGKLEGTVYQDDDQELIFSETVGDMKSLIVYCRAISLKPWSFERQSQTPVSNMFSFGEPSAIRRCEKYPIQMLACTERQLVRTYPRGTRFDSANYPAMTMWQCGVQMVALNFQYPDVHMHLNQGLFRLNEGCGYVLKPKVMRQPNPEVDFDPRMTTPHPDVTPVRLEIELLSGQRLCYWGRKCLSCTVDIHTYGIPHDTDTASMSTAHTTDLLWPQWQEGQHVLSKRILMPELCLVYFRVEVVRGARASRNLYGQNCIPLISLLPGIKYVPLRTLGGELIPESGLFLRIKKEEERESQVTDPLRRRPMQERGGARRGVAQPRREATHQQLSGDLGDSEVDVNKSLFISSTVRERLANGHRQHEYEEEEEEEEEDYEFKVQRSATSPPLLESVTRPHPLVDSSLSNDQGHPLSPNVPDERKREIRLEAEIHELEPITGTSHPSPRQQAAASNKPQLLSVEPSEAKMEGGERKGKEREGEVDVEIEVAGEKTFSLKFSEKDL